MRFQASDRRPTKKLVRAAAYRRRPGAGPGSSLLMTRSDDVLVALPLTESTGAWSTRLLSGP